jgi:hypothetical protein
MKRLKVFEEYVESSDYKISVFFKELKAQIERWFTEGSLAAQGCELDGEIDITNSNPMEKFLIFNFTEQDEDDKEETFFRYRVTFMVRLDEMEGDEDVQDAQNSQEETPTPENKSFDVNKVLLKIHQFDEENNEKGELVEDVNVDDIKENFIIDKLGQLKDKSETPSEEETDLKDDIYVK